MHEQNAPYGGRKSDGHNLKRDNILYIYNARGGAVGAGG